MNNIKETTVYKIKYLDGPRLKNAILASIGYLEQHLEYLNRINVFPVPDGDTGTNMFLTMRHISSGLAGYRNRSIGSMSSQVAEFALMGAQGNSGAILAQFFHGFALEARGKWHLTTRAFARAVHHAKDAAYSALTDPREGTILTVISDWSNYIHTASQKTEDFVTLLKKSLHTARISLAETQKKLEVLKKSGVVDAGAQGFVHILEGVVHFIEKGKIKQVLKPDPSPDPIVSPILEKEMETEIKFRYCTECLVSARSIDHVLLKKKLMNLGDSLIAAGGTQRVRVHIHTDTPASVFDILSEFGEISAKKIDDMLQQHNVIRKPGAEKIAIVTDSSCDLPLEFITRHHIHVIPLQLTFGTQTFLDKVQITPGEFYEKLAVSPVHPTTSQPTTAGVIQVYREAMPRFDRILSIHLPRVVSGTFQVIEKAAREVDKDKITCIDGKNITVALGLVVMEAAAAIEEGLPVDKVIERIHEAIENIHIFVVLHTLKYVVRGGRLSRSRGIIGKILHLNPVLSFDPEGRVVTVAKAIGEKNALEKSIRIGLDQARRYREIKLIVAHAHAYAKAERLAAELAGRFNIKGEIPILEAAPVLGVHAGPGAVGFAFIGYGKTANPV